jgi:flagellar P-ring protein FlgI
MRALTLLVASLLAFLIALPADAAVRIKDLGRFDGVRDSAILGYGLVVGLAGTGDSPRSRATLQSVSNMLREFGLLVPPESIGSRNVAAVIVTADLPAFLRVGDRLDVNVAALGDARSLAGGTLLATPMIGTDRTMYALAQGPVSVGAYHYEQNGTSLTKNHPTAGMVPEGAIAERALSPALLARDGTIDLLLNEADFTTAARVAGMINREMPATQALAVEAGRVRLKTSGEAGLVNLIAAVENLAVEPDAKARVVVSERTGTIVSGGNVWISEVTVTQGDIRVAITQRFLVSQPYGFLVEPSRNIRTAVVPESEVAVREPEVQTVSLPQGATIGDLVNALKSIRASSRDVIAILQGIKRAGALHAELVIQ